MKTIGKMIRKMIVDHDLIRITFFAPSDHDLIGDNIFPIDRDLIRDHENGDRSISWLVVGRRLDSIYVNKQHGRDL